MDIWERLAIALALGLLVGAERGWHERQEGEGRRVAGIRTFGLIALLGALWAILAQLISPLVLGFAFVAFAGILGVAHYLDTTNAHDLGITTVVAALVTFTLGALSVLYRPEPVAAAAVVMTTLLGLKPMLHHGLARLEQRELYDSLKLLLISVVLLPILPDRGYGPWQLLNPYVIWLFVVLVAAISYVGYFAIRITGARLGILLTGMFGGLASSTALSLDFARRGRLNVTYHALLAVGVIVAASTMFPRVFLVVGLVNPSLLVPLAPPLLAAAAIGYGFAAWGWWRAHEHAGGGTMTLSNPFELLPALKFGVLLVGIMLAAKLAQQWFGDTGVYVTAALSGIADVDAITLSLARMAAEGLSTDAAVLGIVIACVVNTAVKAALVVVICGGAMARRVAAALGAAALVAVSVVLLS